MSYALSQRRRVLPWHGGQLALSSYHWPGNIRELQNLIKRAVILHTLEATSWVIGGLNGAAVKLGLKRTTLICKMRRLGICKPVLLSSSDLMDSALLKPALVPQLQ
jgi:transcriptional regulator with GAF, ATPase, and Fis domain